MANILNIKLLFVLSIFQNFLSSDGFKTPADRIFKFQHSSGSIKRNRRGLPINPQRCFQPDLRVPINSPSVFCDPILVGVDRRLQQCASRNQSQATGNLVYLNYLFLLFCRTLESYLVLSKSCQSFLFKF